MAQNYAISFKFTLLDKMTVPAKSMAVTMGGLSKNAAAASKSMESFRSKHTSMASSVFKGLVGFGLLNTGLNLVRTGFDKVINGAARAEMSIAGFTTLLGGSEESAKKLVTQLQELGARTPFEYNDLADATSMLLGFGAVTKDTASETLRQLGDLSQGSAVHLTGIARAYGQVMAGGRATMQDVNQLVNNQVPLLQQLAKQWGVSMSVARKMVEQGKATGEEVSKAFKIMTSEGGMFYKGMDRASQTFEGKMSTLRDAINISAARIGTALLPTLKTLVDIITKLVEKMIPFIETLGQIISKVWEYRDALIPLIAALVTYKFTTLAIMALGWIKYLWMMRSVLLSAAKAQWGLNIAMNANPIGIIISSVAALAAGVYLVYKYWDDILMALQEAVNWVLKLVGLMPSGGGKTNIEKEMEARKAAQGLNGSKSKSDINISVTGKDGATATIEKVNNSGSNKPNIKTNNGRTLSYAYDGMM